MPWRNVSCRHFKDEEQVIARQANDNQKHYCATIIAETPSEASNVLVRSNLDLQATINYQLYSNADLWPLDELNKRKMLEKILEKIKPSVDNRQNHTDILNAYIDKLTF